VTHLSDIVLGNDAFDDQNVLSCHHLSHGLSRVFPEALKVVDGEFVQGFYHSWLDAGQGFIVDPYPVMVVSGPLLLFGHRTPYTSYTPWKNMYFPKTLSFLETELFKKQCVQVIRAIYRICRIQGIYV
jgi:hypothetical protein